MSTDLQATQADMPVYAPENGVSGKRRGRKRKIVRWIIVLIVVAAAAAAGLWYFNSRTPKSAAAAAYTEYTVARTDIMESLNGTGALQPADSYTVTTLVEGEILSANFEEGDVVEKDSVLYTVDSSDKTSSIERAELSLTQARTNYQRKQDNLEKLNVTATGAGVVTMLNIEVGDNVTSGQMIASVVDSATMKLTLPFLYDDAANIRVGDTAYVTLDGSYETLTGTVIKVSATNTTLAGNIIVRQVTLEVPNPGALSESHSATAAIGDAVCAASGTFTYNGSFNITAEISGKVDRLLIDEGDTVSRGQTVAVLVSDTLNDEIQNAYNSMRDAEIALQNQYDQLDAYTITSPITGTVIEKTYKLGDTMSAGKALCTIYDLSSLTFTMNIDELDIRQVEVGQEVTVTADAVEGKTFKGVVTKISVQGATSGGVTSYPVTVRIDETEGLLPGMNVNATIVLRSAENVLAVPVAAVARGNRVLVKTGGTSNTGENTQNGMAEGRGSGNMPEDFDPANMPEGFQQGNMPEGFEPGNIPEGFDPENMPDRSTGGNTVNNGPVGTFAGTGAPDGYMYVQVTTGATDGTYVEITSGLNEGDIVAYITQTANTGNYPQMTMAYGGMGGAAMPQGEFRSVEIMPGG